MASSRSVLENRFVRFSLALQDNTWTLEDRRAGVTWGNLPEDRDLPGEPWLHLLVRGAPIPLVLRTVAAEEGALRARFYDPQGGDSGLEAVFRLEGPALQVYLISSSPAFPPLLVFSRGLEAPAYDDGLAVLPIRLGLLLPAAGNQEVDLRLGTYDYEGLHMAMAGLMKSGAALMLAWHDPYIALNLTRSVNGEPFLRLAVELTRSARSFELHCLGKGDYHTIAAAYRERAAALGYRLPWSEKLASRPQAERLFGASNFKLWTALARRIDENLVEQEVDVKWTFDEAAQVGEHLKNDLQLEEVLFHLGGWSTYGYDCRHPDIMPANPECGGDSGLADCARRIQACGYLFCLHDNYQDMYRDAPSWDEVAIQKQPDGALTQGGVWLGGRAYITCAREALKLAQRPENLLRVREVAHPDVYFIDTTYAAGLQECYDPRHPLTKSDDLYWKQALSSYAREVFGLFGSECGREWAVAHADFFEGLASVGGRYYHMLKPEELGAWVMPLFEMVFHDCITIHGKYGYEPAAMAEQVIHHAAIGRTLYYHSVGPHLYWQEAGASAELPPADSLVDPALYTRAHGGWAEGLCLWDRFIKNTHEILSPLSRRTAQALLERYEFMDEARLVRRSVFSNGVQVLVNGSAEDVDFAVPFWGSVVLPPYGLLVEAGDFAALVARSWDGHSGAQPVLFTFTSLDGLALPESSQVRVYHGFGDAALNWRGKPYIIRRESILES
jgi:hypothetical protein